MILQPKNWTEFQHYKDRDPTWIKLHKRLLDDYEFQSLPLIARAVAPMLWLLASENKDGAFDADEKKLSFRLRVTADEIRVAMAALLDAGFFVEVEVESPTRSTVEERRVAAGFGTRHISDEVKRAVWARDEGKCQACASAENIEYDHIVPVSKGGNSEQENVQLLCRPCNRSKRTKTAKQFDTDRLSSRSLETENKRQVKTQVETEDKRARRAASNLPADCPTAEDQEEARKYWLERNRQDLVVRLADEVAAFRAHHEAYGKRMVDWSAAWRTWRGNAMKFNRAPDTKPTAKIISILEPSDVSH